MKSKLIRTLLIVFAVAAVCSAAVYFFINPGKPDIAAPSAPISSAYEFSQSTYSQNTALSVKGANGEIFMPTDIDGIYYTADLKNNVSFYSYSNGAFSAYTGETKTVDVSLKATYEKIPVTVKYISENGKTFGCGVFTADMDKSVEVYGFAFVKLMNKPSGYGDGFLLLADFNPDDFYKAEKTYSEIYDISLPGGKTSTYVSNNTRLIDKNGSFRQDWTMLTDEFIKGMGNKKYFLSSRYYTQDEYGQKADVMILSGAYRPEIVIKKLLGTWFVSDEHGLHYIKGSDKVFKNIVYSNKKEIVLAEFEGNYFSDYLRCGNYIINKKSLVMTDLLTGETKTLMDINIENADGFSLSPDASKAVFLTKGKTNENGVTVQTLTYCTVDGSVEPSVFCEPLLYSERCSFVWLDNSSVMSVRPLDGSGKINGSVVYTF